FRPEMVDQYPVTEPKREKRFTKDNLLGLIGNLDDGLTNLKGKLGHGGKLIPGLEALKGYLGDYMDKLNIKKRSPEMVDQYPVTEPKREKRFTKDNLLGLIGNLDDGLTNLKGKLGHGGKLIPGLEALKGYLGDYMDKLNIKKRSPQMVDQYPVTEPKREKRFTKDNLLGLIGNLDDGLTNLKGKLGHGGKLIPGLEALKGYLGDYMDKLNIKKRSPEMVDQYPVTEPKREKRFTKDNLLGLIGNLDDGLTNLKGKLGHGGKLIPGLEALKGYLGDYMDKLNIKKRSPQMVDQYPVTEPKREKRFTKDNLLGLIGNLDDGLTNLKGKLGHGGKLIPGLEALKGYLGDYMDKLNIKKRSPEMVDQYPVTEPKREKRFTKDNLLGLIGNLDDGLTNLKGKLGHGGKLIPGLEALKGYLGDYMDKLNIKKRSPQMVDQYPVTEPKREKRFTKDNLLGLIGNLDDGLTNLKGKLGHGGKLIPGLEALKGYLGDYMDKLNIKKRSPEMVDQYPVTEPKREKRFTKDNLLGLIGNLDDGLTNLKGKLGHGGKLIPGLEALKGYLGDYMDKLNIKKRSPEMVDQYPVTEPKREKRFTKDNLLGLIGNLDDGLTNLKGKLGHGGKLIPGLEALKGYLGDYMDKLNIKKRSSV
ncbi:hypothetical protein PFISCL1PPCAC_26713, partial [Pristionchus fissidentatus]